MTIDYGDGRVLVRTITGHERALRPDPAGRPVDVIPGMWGPAAFVRRSTRPPRSRRACAALTRAHSARRAPVRIEASTSKTSKRRCWRGIASVRPAVPTARAAPCARGVRHVQLPRSPRSTAAGPASRRPIRRRGDRRPRAPGCPLWRRRCGCCASKEGGLRARPARATPGTRMPRPASQRKLERLADSIARDQARRPPRADGRASSRRCGTSAGPARRSRLNSQVYAGAFN